jgi:hypothetical protein
MRKFIVLLSVIILMGVTVCSCVKVNTSERLGETSEADEVVSDIVESKTETGTSSVNAVVSGEQVSSTQSQVSNQPASSTVTSSAPVSSQYIPRPKNPEMLSEAQIKKIREDYAEYFKREYRSGGEYTAEDVWIWGYYGTYNGNIALGIETGFGPTLGYYVDIAGYTFYLGDSGFTIDILTDSGFVVLGAAYESGLITKQDVQDIHYYNQNDTRFPAP